MIYLFYFIRLSTIIIVLEIMVEHAAWWVSLGLLRNSNDMSVEMCIV